MKVLRPLVVALSMLLVLTGCTKPSVGDGRLRIVVAFYPLQYVAEQVGGDLVTATNLTHPGSEPHDLELTAQQVASLATADLVFYEKGFQPAVDTAVSEQRPSRVLDAATLVPLRVTTGFEAEQGAATALDPHSWLDPTTMATYGKAVAEQLALARPEQAAAFRQRADALAAALTTLDTEFRTGLARCDRTAFVTSHAAFGYLAERYGLEQVGITGLSPDAEPTPARLAEVQQVAKAKGVTTIFAETLASPALAKALATDLGLTTDVLDPLEGITDQSRGTDYPAVMRSNLAALEKANGCH